MGDSSRAVAATGNSYGVPETAELLGISRDTVRRRRKSGDLQAVETPDGSERVDAAQVEAERAELLRKLQAQDARGIDPGSSSSNATQDAAHRLRDLEDERAAWVVERSRLLARVAELGEMARGLRRMQEEAMRLVDQRLAPDTLND